MNITLQTTRWIVTRVRNKFGIKIALKSLYILWIARLKVDNNKSINQHNDLFVSQSLE